MNKKQIKQWNYMHKLRQDRINHDSHKARLDLWMDQLSSGININLQWEQVKRMGRHCGYSWTEHQASSPKIIKPFVKSYPKLRLVVG